jgi:hypothetical protein
MSSYDISALRAALNAGSNTRRPRVKTNEAIKKILDQWNILDGISDTASKNELCYWEQSEVHGTGLWVS